MIRNPRSWVVASLDSARSRYESQRVRDSRECEHNPCNQDERQLPKLQAYAFGMEAPHLLLVNPHLERWVVDYVGEPLRVLRNGSLRAMRTQSHPADIASIHLARSGVE